MITLCNNFPISHLRIVTYIILVSIDDPASESVLLPDNVTLCRRWGGRC